MKDTDRNTERRPRAHRRYEMKGARGDEWFKLFALTIVVAAMGGLLSNVWLRGASVLPLAAVAISFVWTITGSDSSD